MSHSYTLEFKRMIVCLHEKKGCTYKNISAEYGVSKASISKWCRKSTEECQEKSLENVYMSIETPSILLLDMAFQSGNCLEQIGHIKNIAERDMAMMQYYYFTCHNEQAAKQAAEYLNCENLRIRIGALLIYTFSSMAMGHIEEAQKGKLYLNELIAKQSGFSRESGIPLMLSAVKMVLHIPLTDTERKDIEEHSGECDEGGRLLCCYLLEQATWNKEEWERIIGSVETALHMTRGSYPLIRLYFYLSASEAALNLKDIRRAENYFQKAWKLAEVDGFWAPVGEMMGHLQLFLEKEVKSKKTVPYKQIVQATHQYRNGWRNLIYEIHSKEEWKKKNMQETLTGMEYAVSFLARLGWSNQEIGDYFGISIRTVKYYMTAVFNKLNINGRQEISEFLD